MRMSPLGAGGQRVAGATGHAHKSATWCHWPENPSLKSRHPASPTDTASRVSAPDHASLRAAPGTCQEACCLQACPSMSCTHVVTVPSSEHAATRLAGMPMLGRHVTLRITWPPRPSQSSLAMLQEPAFSSYHLWFWNVFDR